jgi:hypothetical protein
VAELWWRSAAARVDRSGRSLDSQPFRVVFRDMHMNHNYCSSGALRILVDCELLNVPQLSYYAVVVTIHHHVIPSCHKADVPGS